MTGQQTLDGGPASTGARIALRFLAAGGVIDHHAWLRACAEHGYVGTCRCGDYLVPDRPDDRGAGRIDYSARCRRATTEVLDDNGNVLRCDFEFVAPGGRVLRRSSMRGEMPGGWWDHRFKTKDGGS